jgi:hypothetical protein
MKANGRGETNNIVMRIYIFRSDNTVDDQLNPVKEKLLREITVNLFDCNYTSYLKNVNQRI